MEQPQTAISYCCVFGSLLTCPSFVAAAISEMSDSVCTAAAKLPYCGQYLTSSSGDNGTTFAISDFEFVSGTFVA